MSILLQSRSIFILYIYNLLLCFTHALTPFLEAIHVNVLHVFYLVFVLALTMAQIGPKHVGGIDDRRITLHVP